MNDVAISEDDRALVATVVNETADASWEDLARCALIASDAIKQRDRLATAVQGWFAAVDHMTSANDSTSGIIRAEIEMRKAAQLVVPPALADTLATRQAAEDTARMVALRVARGIVNGTHVVRGVEAQSTIRVLAEQLLALTDQENDHDRHQRGNRQGDDDGSDC